MTEEGKRTCPYADRPILEALRLPSSVTAPHDLLFVIGLVLSQNAVIQIIFCSGAAPPSPRGKAFASSNVLCTAKRFHITINLFARGRFPHKKRHPCTPTFPHPTASQWRPLSPADRTPTFSAKKRHNRKPMHHVRMCANHFHKRIPSESCQSLLPRRRWHTACDGGDLIVLG